MLKNLSIWGVLLILVGGLLYFKNFQVPLKQTVSRNTLNPTPTVVPTPVATLKPKVLLDVPFISQAPTGNWTDPRLQDGCEEAAALMAYLWATEGSVPKDIKEQEKKLQEISDWEEKNYGSYHDTQAKDTVERIYKKYLSYDKVRVREDVTTKSIKEELSQGNLVQIPADGQKLKNPNYTAPGPERHNLIIIGYDDSTQEFITNDNGTRHGKGYKYKYDVMLSAIRDYPTGNHNPITENKKVMIVITHD